MSIKNDKEYIAVVYTDGSAQPNPGPYGGGAHGYLFLDIEYKNNTDRPNHYMVSDRGYLEKHEITDADRVVKPELYYNATYSYGKYGTNNQAELSAVFDTIDILSSKVNLKKIIILTDSTYTISVFNVVRKDLEDRKWLLMDRPNLDLWEKLANVLVAHKDMDISLSKVKAHGTAVGNNAADRLAYSARELSGRGVVGNR